ncbi:glycosyltransferase [Puia sp. P3]|uniref:glycosyltransferase n=1 Tax=Puia sp. P3 TaxID=3423952 RepID=UPI003D672FEA
MNILLTVDPEIPVPPGLYGGIERIVDGLINAYLEAGHKVTLCANKESKVPCRLVAWPGQKSQQWSDTLKNMAALTGLVMKGRFDVIHSYSRLAYMTALFPMRIPKIMSYQREPSLGQIGKAVKLAKKGSLVFTGCSGYIANQILQVAEAYTIYNFAPVRRYTATAEVGPDAPLVFLGRLEHIKGPHIAIEVAKTSGRRLVIAGNLPPEAQGYFDEKIRPYLDDRITYIGPVNDEQKNALLGQALAMLMPIQWNEPFGIVMAEAMACGTPVLGFPYGSVPEVVDNGVTGFVCADVREMVDRIGDLGAISRAGVRKMAEQRFTDKVIAGDYLALYEKLISRSAK